MNKTAISWVLGPDGKPGFTWNPGAGCSAKPISKGCEHCWAARLAATRLDHRPGYADPSEWPKVLRVRQMPEVCQ